MQTHILNKINIVKVRLVIQVFCSVSCSTLFCGTGNHNQCLVHGRQVVYRWQTLPIQPLQKAGPSLLERINLSSHSAVPCSESLYLALLSLVSQQVEQTFLNNSYIISSFCGKANQDSQNVEPKLRVLYFIRSFLNHTIFRLMACHWLLSSF